MSAATPSTTSPRRQPSPARSFRSRMGTLLRRNSSNLGFSRPSSPFRSDSKSSPRVSTDVPAQPAQEALVPSPVAESPAREAEAEQSSAPAVAASSSLAKEVTASPEATPAALTAEPESLPAASTAPKEEAVQPVAEAAAQTSQPEAPQPEASQVQTSTQPPADPHPAPESQPPAATAATEPVPEPKPVAVEEREPGYFGFSDDLKVKPTVSQDGPSPAEAITIPVPETHPAPSTAVVAEPETSTKGKEVDAPQEVHDTGFAWKDDSEYRTVSPKRSSSSVAGSATVNAPIVGSPESISRNLSPKTSKSSLSSSYGHVVVSTAGRRVSVSLDPNSVGDDEPRRGRSRASSVHVSINDRYSDPFADPPNVQAMPEPSRVLSPIDSVAEPAETPNETPVAEGKTGQVTTLPYTEERTYSSMPDPVVMPLPPASSVIGSHKQVKQVPSEYSLTERPNGPVVHQAYETDERLPLLGSTKSTAHPDVSTQNAIVFPSAQTTWPTPAQSLQSLGWTEHLLPDNSHYYYHKGMRITTDIDLRNIKKLEAITEYLDRKLPEEVSLPPEGWELWLRDVATSKHGFSPMRNWVNHKAKVITFKPPPAPVGEVDTPPDHITDDDRLDMEYRYWAFLEGHPAHISLPDATHGEAMDALTWSYTDYLLPGSQSVPPPFSPQECQELMGLLRSFEDKAKRNVVVHTRVVSRVLLRVVQWRQQYFRPNKPLPRDIAKGPLRPERRLTFRRATLDVIMSVVCLGIPYLFMNRSRGHRIDEESGLQSAGPMLMIGACACLVSAVILSASVTFLTLPGLDDVARLAGMIAILFSASSMVSSVVALFRYKADVERTVVYVGGEGLMLLSRQSIIMSFPLVFLAWAIAAFVTAITFYSFRGATITGRAIIREPFQDYTHWAMVGTLGGLAGILIMSMLLARRSY